MIPKLIPINTKFVGREFEISRIAKIVAAKISAIIIVYGRRRIGKTELLEQCFRERNVLKFEGKEKQSELMQMRHVLNELSKYASEPLLQMIEPKNWQEVFEIIHRYTQQGQWTIYFEEVQWLADYNDNFISDLKYAWDNYFRYNNDLIVILCGSAPSFMINQVAHSKALYNRSQHEIALEQLTLSEAKLFLKKRSDREVMDAFLTVGGIPLYLEKLKESSSVFLSLCEHAFTKKSFFSVEYKSIFVSSLSNNPHYKQIVEFLSKKKYATRDGILKHLKLVSGKNVTELLVDLELCGFITKYAPYNLAENSMLSRYAIQDNYLQFYNNFIRPISKDIEVGKFTKDPSSAIKIESYLKWLGFSFERFCRRYHYIIANILGFSGVHYLSGTYYNRALAKNKPNFQIDLLFDRDDNVVTICEIRYTKNPVTASVIEEFERKVELFQNPQNKTIHRVLISASGADDSVKNQAYFDKIVTLQDIFNAEHY
ncbi:MAG: ATP-binding protein [Pseudomonadota bacterium]|nr:ATP-binding protein [Pseudomonadota bacterium]